MTSTSKTGTRRRYTAVEREAAVKLAAKVGVNEAARRLKVPQPTLSHWRAGRGDVGAAVSAATKTKTTTTRAKGGAGRGKRDATTQTATTSTPAAPAAPLAPRPPASRRNSRSASVNTSWASRGPWDDHRLTRSRRPPTLRACAKRSCASYWRTPAALI